MTTLHLNPTFPLFDAHVRAFPYLGRLFMVLLGIALLTLGARVQVPMWPVPMTLQSLAVLVIAATYGLPLALATVGGYLLLGFAGAPVFATGGGLHYLWAPTAGFLFSYMAAVLVVAGPLMRWPELASKLLPVAVLMALASGVIWLVGGVWLARFAPQDAGALAWAWQKGIGPFLLGGTVKAMLATAITLSLFKSVH